jgi:hypothetical protein
MVVLVERGMWIRLAHLQLLMLLLMLLSDSARSESTALGVIVTDLQTEHLTDPLGLDKARPLRCAAHAPAQGGPPFASRRFSS